MFCAPPPWGDAANTAALAGVAKKHDAGGRGAGSGGGAGFSKITPRSNAKSKNNKVRKGRNTLGNNNSASTTSYHQQTAGTATASEQQQQQQQHQQQLQQNSSLSFISSASSQSLNLLLQSSQHQQPANQRQPLPHQARHQALGRVASNSNGGGGGSGGGGGGGGRGGGSRVGGGLGRGHLALTPVTAASRVVKGGTRGLYAQVRWVCTSSGNVG